MINDNNYKVVTEKNGEKFYLTNFRLSMWTRDYKESLDLPKNTAEHIARIFNAKIECVEEKYNDK